MSTVASDRPSARHPYGLGDRYEDYRHPSTVSEVVALVQEARQTGQALRVRGSGHSERGALFGTEGRPTLRVMLDRLAEVRFLERRQDGARVRVLAGCSLGGDPHAPRPAGLVDEGHAASLCRVLDAAGYACPVLGGITHQTLGGFLATGSQGASCTHAFDASVAAIDLVDGLAVVRRFERGDPLFGAAIASLGLLGVVVAVELDVVPRYGVRGRVSTQPERDAEIDLFGDGDAARPSLAQFLDRQEYARLMWWPQRDVRRIEVWQGYRVPCPPSATELRPNAHLVLAPLLQRVVRKIYLSVFPSVPLPPDTSARGARRWRRLVGAAIRLFIRESPVRRASVDEAGLAATVRFSDERFYDTWHEGLSMDNPMRDDLMPVQFTELWVPLERAGAVMRVLRDYYEGRLGGSAHELDRTGTFCVEIYGAPASPSWIAANHGTKVVRIDPFRFDDGDQASKQAFFEGIWRVLAPLGFRPHWGKALSEPGSSSGVAHRHAQLPRLAEFLEVRERFDPDGVFLHDYWRRHLGIEDCAGRADGDATAVAAVS